MTRILRKRFQLQLLFALVAALSVAALAVTLVLNAVQHAERFVLADTGRALDRALDELEHEYQLRLRSEAPWTELSLNAQDVTLRAISQTVLSAYPGVEGGYWMPSRFLGYSYPTHDSGSPKIDVPAAEQPTIQEVLAQARETGRSRRVLRGRHDLVMISAIQSGAVGVWAMKRMPGQAESGQRTNNVLLTALGGSALLGAAGVLATAIGLHRGVAQIKQSLSAPDRALVPVLPERRDELGEISAAINNMERTRRRLEAEVRREDRARTMGHLVGRIAHEMRNPLNSMRLSLRMLSQRHAEHRLRPDDFQMVIEEVDRMNRLLSDLLTFQQPRPPQMESCVAGPLLEECTQLVRQHADQEGVSLLLAGNMTQTILADTQYFRQILVNLILNAIDVSRPGECIQIAAVPVGGLVEIEVSDEGLGLSAEQQDHLFEPFFTTKSQGHGLGLAVSRELAQSMGGCLLYRPDARGRTTFVLQIKGTNAA